MSEQQLEDPLLLAVSKARPAIDDAALSPTSADALRVLERVLHDKEVPMSVGVKPKRSRLNVAIAGGPFGRRVLRPGIGAIAAAAVVAALVIALGGVSGAPSLVARAYAAINPRDQVLHEVDIYSERGLRGFYERLEGWLLPANGRAHTIFVSGYKQSSFVTINEVIITASGQVYGRACLSGCNWRNARAFIDGHSRWGYAGRVSRGTATFGITPGPLPGTFAQRFSTAYRAGAIAPDGTTSFAGRRAARFQSMSAFGGSEVYWRPGTQPPASARHLGQYVLIDWYIDPGTAQPVGFAVSGCASDQTRSCSPPASTVRIATFQLLDPTSQNLALLTGPSAPSGAR